jgi:hypothetical protein
MNEISPFQNTIIYWLNSLDAKDRYSYLFFCAYRLICKSRHFLTPIAATCLPTDLVIDSQATKKGP